MENENVPQKPVWEVLLLILTKCRIGMSMRGLEDFLNEAGIKMNRRELAGRLETLRELGWVDVLSIGPAKVYTVNGLDVDEEQITKLRRRIQQFKKERKEGVLDPLILKKAFAHSVGPCPECHYPLIHSGGCILCTGCGWTCTEGQFIQ